jgi:hypothetical protein
MTEKQTTRQETKYWIGRLNVLLRFDRVDPWTLNNGALEKLVDEMHFAVYGSALRSEEPDVELFRRPHFHSIATREALSEAQRGLDRAIQVLLVKPPGTFKLGGQTVQMATLKLARQTLQIVRLGGDTFASWSQSDHFPSQVYTAFAEVLKASGRKPSDFLHCSRCGTWFVPLRRPRKGTPTYCSPKCARAVASKHYRARLAAKTKSVRVKKKKKP